MTGKLVLLAGKLDLWSSNLWQTELRPQQQTGRLEKPYSKVANLVIGSGKLERCGNGKKSKNLQVSQVTVTWAVEKMLRNVKTLRDFDGS